MDMSHVQSIKLSRVTQVLGRTGCSIIQNVKGLVHEGNMFTLLESERGTRRLY
ncbi:40S ribosomal protein S28-like [Myotis myotis]|uniref:40S ribosomal protein S28-like n=1 Tax=Myotis myotis TaxID=51298 RepID=UPI0017490B9F|nr:40S ribosomal protein S28-like [Myotis myotis]